MVPSNKLIKLALGSVSLIQPVTGIGQYTLNLSQALTEIHCLDIQHFYGYDWSSLGAPKNSPKLSLIKKLLKEVIPRPYEVNRLIQQRAFNAGVKAFKPTIYHEPSFLPLEFDGPTVITVHDLSHIRYPDSHPKERVATLNRRLPKAVENAQCILTDSNFTKQEILSQFSVKPDKVVVTHLGFSADFYPRQISDSQAVISKYQLIANQYVLAVGTLEPRKNLIQAIRAYSSLPKSFTKKCPLVIVGARGWKEQAFMKELVPLINDGRALLLGYIPSADLPFLYSAAIALIYPSVYEGFGLPPLEAMACGTTVITTNRSSIPEVVADSGIMVDAGNISATASAIQTLFEDIKLRQSLAIKSIKQSANFSWEKCAQLTYGAYLHASDRT